MLTRTSVSGGASSASSRPTVPWPAITVGSSNGCTSVKPSATNSSSSANAAPMSSVSRSSAPAARMRSIDRGGAVLAITTVARTSIPLATSATAMPWLPPLTATTPASPSSGLSASSFVATPRGLNDPDRWSSSSLSVTGTPRSALIPGLATVGVRSTWPLMVLAAARTPSRESRFAIAATLLGRRELAVRTGLGFARQRREERWDASRAEVVEPRPLRLDRDARHLRVHRPDGAFERLGLLGVRRLPRASEVLVRDPVDDLHRRDPPHLQGLRFARGAAGVDRHRDLGPRRERPDLRGRR